MLKIMYTQLNIDAIPQKERHEAEHFAAHTLLQEGLKRMGLPPAEVRYDDNGKPYLEGIPFHLSLSHSKGIAVCALADTPVGVDVEVIRPKKLESIKRVATRMFTAHEQKYLAEQEYALTVFYEIWVKKEALVKQSGIGVAGMAEADSSSDTIISYNGDDFILAVAKNPAEPFIPEVLPDVDSHKKSGF